ncbi:L-amino acid N-acyltransferase YncA [Natranaerovirga hydrolytica]|uniref:L-amino acid N-acyltransferase YncA n=1 Tax=Natranaerovirga hydrolytica TaxID=680378 RepID=A0A4R1N1C6_9FIRM|nr:GNAT family N-acetyltransferase [Natranaerovirga hydrolytica]TCK98750.1 L-amino acid N-acyltransferase YncA [Natranaerovirga hydrolytica]
MSIRIRAYNEKDLPAMLTIWNDIVEEGNAFPQMKKLDIETGRKFFEEQSYTGVAIDNHNIVGMYILHPNNVGRCGHISNASYGVKKGYRGKKLGEKMVLDSLREAKRLKFRIMQFNAVVKNNEAAIHLYEKIGFQKLGVIPKGFLLPDGSYEDIISYYISLDTIKN